VTTPATPWQPPASPTSLGGGFELASPGARLVGYIIDIMIQFVLVAVTLAIAAMLGAIIWPVGVLCALLVIPIAIGYFPYFWVSSGQTPGMSVMKIKVVRDSDGGPVEAGPALLRLLGFWLSTAIFYLGFIWIFVDKRRRGWMDLLAGTVVVAVPPTVYTA
jgi:uncharacterized RDD family membrane protein YckC